MAIVLESSETAERPTFATALFIWWKIGVLSFGGPAAQIALMHRILVEEKRWLSEQRYLDALSFCMLLPGPEAMQLATYAGWRQHGVAGGLAAGLSFVLPGALVIVMLALLYVQFGDVALVDALFLGVKAAVLVIVIEALIKVARRALHGTAHHVIAGLAFIGIFFLALPFPVIVLAAGLYGFFAARGATSPDPSSGSAVALPEDALAGTLRTAVVWLAIWWLPVLLLRTTGADVLLTELAGFFSRLAVVTFGGAYAVLAYMAQDVVGQHGWLTAGEMMDSLGLAETTPGPLILVTEFVGFLAGFKAGGLPLAFAAAAVTLWVTFIPCFLWIFAGAPYIEWLGSQPRLRQALAAITAAVVGVILNLSLWFALHVLFATVEPVDIGPLRLWQPELATLDWRVLLLIAGSGLMLLRWHWNVALVLAVSALGGAALSLPSLT